MKKCISLVKEEDTYVEKASGFALKSIDEMLLDHRCLPIGLSYYNLQVTPFVPNNKL